MTKELNPPAEWCSECLNARRAAMSRAWEEGRASGLSWAEADLNPYLRRGGDA